MRQVPPEVVASWPKPNYINPDTRGPALVIVELITLSIALVILVLRLYVRIKIMRKTGWDDWLMVFSAVSTATLFPRGMMANCTCALRCVLQG
jgi:hypothetical protein